MPISAICPAQCRQYTNSLAVLRGVENAQNRMNKSQCAARYAGNCHFGHRPD
jgi:hypothetical protein